MSSPKKVILKSGKDQSLRRYHPWVFSGAIKKMDENIQEGDLVKVYDNKDEFLAIGHYQIGSIAVRVISFEDRVPNDEFWVQKLSDLYNYRKKSGLLDSKSINVYRLVHAEGDGMPGLIADYYNGVLVLQFHSVGMFLIQEELISAFRKVIGDELVAIYNKSKKTLPFKADINSEDGLVFGDLKGLPVTENDNLFKVDFEKGQKTGFFIDQRENRKLVERYSNEKNVLNLFGYTGGFSVYALRGNAALVHTVDSSASAIDMANENVNLNFKDTSKHEAIVADAFKFLETVKDKYDLIILDPPAFAKHHNVLHQALQGYKRLNAMAFDCIRPGGIIFTFSCSQVVSKENFRKSVFVAAANSGRSVRILHQLTQPVDHPVNIYHPEGEYLKGLVLYVE